MIVRAAVERVLVSSRTAVFSPHLRRGSYARACLGNHYSNSSVPPSEVVELMTETKLDLAGLETAHLVVHSLRTELFTIMKRERL